MQYTKFQIACKAKFQIACKAVGGANVVLAEPPHSLGTTSPNSPKREANRRFTQANAYRVVDQFVERSRGRRAENLGNRPRLSAALKHAHEEECPILVASLGSLSRDVGFIGALTAPKTPFIVAGDDPFTLRAYRTWTGDERVHHGRRIKRALTSKKAEGVRLGNPTNLREAGLRGRVAQAEQADAFAAKILPIIEGIRADGVTSWNGIAKALNERGIETARGGRWAAMTVKRIVERGDRSTSR